jgi:hypothetical protein
MSPSPNPATTDWVPLAGVSGGGGAGGVAFEFTQVSPSATWTVTHNLGVHPSVTVVDTGDSVIEPNVHYDSLNAITISFGGATSGKAFLN